MQKVKFYYFGKVMAFLTVLFLMLSFTAQAWEARADKDSEFHTPLKTGRISADFGELLHPLTRKKQMHTGVDIAEKSGVLVFASLKGVVEKVAEDDRRGKYIILSHINGYSTYYGHLSEVLVKPGQTVRQEQAIGKVGNTGVSSAPHLHFEIRKDERPLDPQDFVDFPFE